MKKILVLLLFIAVSFSSFCQITGTRVVRIANATTIFSEPLSEGNILIDLGTDKTYLILKGVPGTESLSSVTENVDYKEIATLDDLTSGTEDATFNTATVDTLVVTSLNYSDSYWDDLQVNIASAKLKPSFEPEWVTYKGGYVLSFENNSSHEMYFTAQLSHKYKDGTDLSFHVHLVYPDGTTGNVDWTFTYSWANIGDNYPDETTVNTQTAATGVINKHTIGEIHAIDGFGKRGSSVLLCSLKRNGSEVNDTYGNSVYLVSLDFHYQIDKPGSNEMIPD